MRDESLAGEEIDRTLRLEREGIEAQIAKFRLWLFVAIFASGPVMSFAGRAQGRPGLDLRVPAIFYGICLTYALAARAYVRRYGAGDWFVFASLTLDMLVFTLPGPVFSRFDANARAMLLPFTIHLLAPGLFIVLFVNLLRMNGRAAVFGAVVATAILLVRLVSLEGIFPPIFGISTGLLFTAVVGVVAARRWRHGIDTFARLQLLRRFLSPSAVERVLRDDHGSALALGGRVTTVTLISADLRGFTRMSEKLAPEEVVRQLNAFHGCMVDQLDAHGGALDKFMGDGILAVFGMGVGADDAPDAGAAQAVACARGMQRALVDLNRERTAAGLPPLEMGLGVHTGQVVAGNIGAPGKRLEFTVIGDAVNTASRLEGLTKEAAKSILISRDTVERLPSPAGLEELPPMTVRGRDAALHVYTFAAG
jgi:class 3 adenylate cyclase